MLHSKWLHSKAMGRSPSKSTATRTVVFQLKIQPLLKRNISFTHYVSLEDEKALGPRNTRNWICKKHRPTFAPSEKITKSQGASKRIHWAKNYWYLKKTQQINEKNPSMFCLCFFLCTHTFHFLPVTKLHHTTISIKLKMQKMNQVI